MRVDLSDRGRPGPAARHEHIIHTDTGTRKKSRTNYRKNPRTPPSSPGQATAGCAGRWVPRARWSFTTASGGTTGASHATSFDDVVSVVSRAAEQSVAGLNEDEADALDSPWNRLLARLELHAEHGARSAGTWRYAADGGADIEITHTTDHQSSGE
ncbi:hypothetical protein [Streptomyces sp. NPDC091215]|uniref:hypothetical protein n=1 Tax=Streptomyces sp. NPDC091215 TaxID=3155192 RepID=UPI00342A3E99